MHDSVFEEKAKDYDHEFTHSYIGAVQRKRIHEFVEEQLNGKNNLKIFELNCGTGEDISFLSKFGEVTSTDVSDSMLRIARKKNPHANIFHYDFNTTFNSNQKFDVIFSNFGGLNCVSPGRLKELGKELSNQLNPGGKLFLVLMHNWSLMEFVYFSLHLQFKKAFRRIYAKGEFNGAPIFYYSRSQMRNLFWSFQLITNKRIGILLSGEYMNRLGKRFKTNEKYTNWLGPVFGSDHIIYVFESTK